MLWRTPLLTYLVLRIVACPWLCALSPHVPIAQSFFEWGETGHHHDGDVEGPEGTSPNHRPCICDGVDLPAVPDTSLADSGGTWCGPLDLAWTPLLSTAPLPLDPDPHPSGPPLRASAPSPRADSRVLRC